ncbi:MAG: lycopene cyclase family protein [Myxococcota bacterium]
MSAAYSPRWNVLVIGAGPAGLAVSASCAEAGLSTLLVDPQLGEPLPNLYGLWVDQVALPPHCYRRRWRKPLFFSDAGGRRVLDREYGHLDNDALARWLTDRLTAAGGEARRGAVTGLEADEEGASATIDGIGSIEADVVIDCTGSARRFLETTPMPRQRAIAWQTAYGIVAEVERIPWDTDQMVLMDYRSVSTPRGEVPSFLYAMPLDERRVLLEETVLASVPAVPRDALERRLTTRLSALGISVQAVHHVEDVEIPMDQPLPRIPQPVIGFGAAAGFVHPATGYSIERSFALAPTVAETIAVGLARGGPAMAARRAWRVIQPRSRRRAYRLARSGLTALLALGPYALGQFMHSFFEMPQHRWRAFLSGSSRPADLAGAMFHLGRYLPLALVVRVAHLVARRGAVDLIMGLVPGLETDVRNPS